MNDVWELRRIINCFQINNLKFSVFVIFLIIIKSSVKTYLYVSYFGLVVCTVLLSILRLMMRKRDEKKAFLLWPIYFISDCIIIWWKPYWLAFIALQSFSSKHLKFELSQSHRTERKLLVPWNSSSVCFQQLEASSWNAKY